MLGVLIVDDKAIIREGLEQLVPWADLGFEVAGSVSSADEALEVLGRRPVEVLLTDIVMPGTSGLDLIGQVHRAYPGLRTVILSSFGEFGYAQEAIRLGVCSYLTKPVDLAELERVFRNLGAQAAGVPVPPPPPRDPGVPAVRPALGLVAANALGYLRDHLAEALSLDVVAEALGVSPVYLSRLFKEKTGENFVDAVNRLRIEKSKEYLRDVTLKVYAVSQAVGYTSPKHFCQKFKELVGLTPKEFRDRLSP